jgi:hypothetical protein
MRFFSISLVITLVASACTQVYIDPPVVFDRPDAAVVSGEPSVELGLFKEQFFTPLNAMDALPVVAGFQGGTWVMPAIHAIAIQGLVTAVATLTMVDDGELVGNLTDSSARLQPTILGYSEIIALPIPVAHAAPNAMRPIDDLFGRSALLKLEVTARDGRTAMSQLEVILVED